MSTDAISPLRQRMIEDMNARKLNPHTQRSHISSCKRFAAYLKRSPDTATADEIRLFQLHLTETGAALPARDFVPWRFGRLSWEARGCFVMQASEKPAHKQSFHEIFAMIRKARSPANDMGAQHILNASLFAIAA